MIKKIVLLSLALGVSAMHGAWLARASKCIGPVKTYVTKNISAFRSLSPSKRVTGATTVATLLTFSALSCYSYAYAAENNNEVVYAEFEKFAQKFAPPKEIQKKIEEHKEQIERYGFGFVIKMPGNAPDIFVKNVDIHRVINAERMRECIRRNNLDRLSVPKKYVYRVNGSWKVFAEVINGPSKNRFTFEEVAELTKLTEETGFRDWGGNLLIDGRDGKITVIDTEDGSFLIGKYRFMQDDIPEHCKIQYVISLTVAKSAMDEKTKAWFDGYANNLIKSPEGTAADLPLPLSTRFDSSDIDFEKVKEEYEEMRKIEDGLWWEEEMCDDGCATA